MSQQEEDLCQARIAFHGRIVADATHEIQNHFAVIKEYNGLISDLLRSSSQDLENCVKRCQEISVNINERARTAADMVEILNRFIHRGDKAGSLFRVEDVVEELVLLMQRSADRNRIVLDASYGRRIPDIFSDASLLQFVIYSIIAPMIEALPEHGRISIIVKREKGKIPRTRMSFDAGELSGIERELVASELMSACLSRLQGSFSMEDAAKKHAKPVLSVPSLS